jgi:hypothetical protein
MGLYAFPKQAAAAYQQPLEFPTQSDNALAQFHIGLTQFADDLVHAVASSGHLENLLSGSVRSG